MAYPAACYYLVASGPGIVFCPLHFWGGDNMRCFSQEILFHLHSSLG